MKNIRTLLLLFLSFALMGIVFNSCKPKTEEVGPNQLTQAEIDDGWILLFDGETTDGWRGYNQEAFPDTGWYVEDGTLHCIESGLGEAGLGGDIIYDKKFSNFHLKLEWKIGKGGNSGIFYLSQEIPGWQIWKTAPEMQILDWVKTGTARPVHYMTLSPQIPRMLIRPWHGMQ